MPVQALVVAWGIPILMVVAAAAIDLLLRSRRLRRQRTLEDLAALSWQQFEEVIADAFRRHGYRVRETGGRGTADGGIDLLLVRGGTRTVVQAKHWRSRRVTVQPVRELYGVQTAMRAEHSMFVAVGRYTADAQAFAATVGMALVDGDELLRVIETGLDGRPLELPRATDLRVPACSRCGVTMVRRTARQGAFAGQDFWGCSGFPACRETIDIHASTTPASGAVSGDGGDAAG